MKKYIILALILFTPAMVSASLSAGVYYGKVEKPSSCPGSMRYSGQLFIEKTNSVFNSFSNTGTISSSMTYAQRRVNEAEHCQLTTKQADQVSKNYEKQYEKTEKKVVKLKNNKEIVTKVSEQNLAQTKRLSELSAKVPQKSQLSDKMIISGNRLTSNIIKKTNKNQLVTFQEKMSQVKKTAKDKFAPSITPKATTVPTPATKPQAKTEAQIREEEDCLPGETLAQCMEEDWDGKYYSAEEYERANGLR